MSEEVMWTVEEKDMRRLKAIEAAAMYCIGRTESALELGGTRAALRGTLEAVRSRLELAAARPEEAKGAEVAV